MTPEARVIQTLFSIQNKEGKKVPFILNPAQRWLDSILARPESNKMILAKARQKGFSAYWLARSTVRCLGYEGTRSVVMSHEGEATTRLLARVHYYLKHLKGPPPSFSRNTRNDLAFDRTDSTFYIGTAGAKAFGRGDTITDLHCSEYAWWEDPIKHQGGAFQAVPMSGRILLESTGNGRANDFYFIWKSAERMGYQRLFYPWYADEEYELPLLPGLAWRPDLPQFNGYLLDLRRDFKLSDPKMNWYEMKLKELRENLRLMQQEYPTEPEHCFQATGGALFPDVELSKSEAWITEKRYGYYCNLLKGHPKKGYQYVVGGDPSGGTGNDDAAMQVICANTGEQVFELFDNTLQPIRFAELMVMLGMEYNEAYLVCESNNHGIAVVQFLRENYNRSKLYKSKPATTKSPPRYGWLNSMQTKHALVDMMQDQLDQITLYGEKTCSELQSFEETPKGELGGRSDNLVISIGLALLGFQKFAHLKGTAPKAKEQVLEAPKRKYGEWTLEEILDSIGKRNKPGRPMTVWPHTGTGYC